MTPEMIEVRFLKTHTHEDHRYKPGDVARLPYRCAFWVVEDGVAETTDGSSLDPLLRPQRANGKKRRGCGCS